MANQPKTTASTYRFTPDDQSLMDALADALRLETGLVIARADAIRVAVRNECRRRGIGGAEGAPRKSKKSS